MGAAQGEQGDWLFHSHLPHDCRGGEVGWKKSFNR